MMEHITVAEAGGTDIGFSIAYSSTTGRVYITGAADEGSSSHNINMTTKGYSATSGAKVWDGAPYDMNTDATPTGQDIAFWKNALSVSYNACYAEDQIHAVGTSVVTNNGWDMTTVKYGSSSVCSGSPIHRMIKNSSTSDAMVGFYPNPFSSTAELRLEPDMKITNGTLIIYDLAGRAVSTIQNITSPTVTINRENLSNGLYFFKLSDGDLVLSQGRFIVTD